MKPVALYKSTKKQLGPYKLKSPASLGGEADSWLAKPLKSAGRTSRQVLIKPVAQLPSSTLPSQSMPVADNFQRLRTALACLNHPNILRLQETRFDDDLFYLVYPYEPKLLSLDQHLAQRPMTLPETLNLMRQVINAVLYAHRQGVLHGSLTPRNILLRGDGKIWVTNFGLAKFDYDVTGTNLSRLAGAMPEYMAPEQFTGYGDFRSDLYALGILLFQLLTGTLPFTGNSTLEIGRRHLNEAVPLPNPRVPVAFETFLGKALHKNPRYRFARAEDLAGAFEQAVQQLSQRQNRFEPQKALPHVAA
ncbi:MAG TPA: serine/threonine-protein kinase [Chloroflexia bacterium]|nr:serine/threonine-protein kinase [Chloroflexia bacterium]